MKVTIKKKVPTFKDLPDGAMFQWQESEEVLLCKLYPSDISDGGNNVFRIDNGRLVYAGPDSAVVPVDVDDILGWAH